SLALQLCGHVTGHRANEVWVLGHKRLLARSQHSSRGEYPTSSVGRVAGIEFDVASLLDDHDVPREVESGSGPPGILRKEIRPQGKQELNCCIDGEKAQQRF